MGLIPAHAGKTRRRASRRSSGPAHPRSRGENAPGVQAGTPQAGSSPLTRGKHVGEIAARDHRGLIPAHAGKTPIVFEAANRCRAHPRSRGENIVAIWRAIGKLGSSPLTRGKLEPGAAGPALEGLIPAHAGKTTPPPEAREPLWAHPRSRGENRDHAGCGPVLVGSSPLTRGKHGVELRVSCVVGLIPAHAGKTRSRRGRRRSGRAHPRSRGENDAPVSWNCKRLGSSPLTRGKL